MLAGVDDRGAETTLCNERAVKGREFYEVWSRARDKKNVEAHHVAMTMIATVLARICAIAPNNATLSVCGALGCFAGT